MVVVGRNGIVLEAVVEGNGTNVNGKRAVKEVVTVIDIEGTGNLNRKTSGEVQNVNI